MQIKTLSIVIPCYNEEQTLESCVDKVLELESDDLKLEVVIVDDCSKDKSVAIAEDLVRKHSQITFYRHDKNQGKGAALRTGFKQVTGDYVAVQDADLEYDPQDLLRLIVPLQEDKADVVLGSRFLSTGAHRVFYFWHSVGNKFLTLLSNMFTDLTLTDMETCYKVFRREVIQSVDIKENRFGFEPEIIAKVAQKRCRIYEMGISYAGRTYSEGKKIGARDGFRALYCILRYNAHNAPMPVQFLLYLFIGGASAAVNLLLFLLLLQGGASTAVATLVSFFAAAAVNYFLCILVLFRHNARWNSIIEVVFFLILIVCMAGFDWWVTKTMLGTGWSAMNSKLTATALGLFLNYFGRRLLIFPEKVVGPWKK